LLISSSGALIEEAVYLNILRLFKEEEEIVKRSAL
jgi:hypothetical protein